MTSGRARRRFAVRRAVAGVAVGAATVVGAAAAVNWAARSPAAVTSTQASGSAAQVSPASQALVNRLAADEALLNQLRHGVYRAGNDEEGLPGPLPKLNLNVPSLNLPAGVPAGQAPPPTHVVTGASGVAKP